MDSIEIDIQLESAHPGTPSPTILCSWIKAALETDQAELTLRIVDEEESAQLNRTYRGKSGPTNVLSFPFKTHDGILHGDIVICAPIVHQEATSQNKSVIDHWAHLTIHGTLHLQGYDHIENNEAQIMEQKEILLLAKLEIPNPYE